MATSKAMQEWEKKYATQIKGLAEANKVDLSTASSMLQANLTGGGQYKGGGTISSVQAAAELAAAQKAGRDQASASAKRAAASVGTPTVAQTPTIDTVYGDYLTTLQSQAEAQRQAEERAAQLRTQQAVSQVEGYIPQIQQQTAKQMQEAYIAAQRAKMQAPQTLSALGYTGGATESSLLGLDTDYMNRRQALAEAEAQSLDQIRQNVADIQASGNVELANLAAQYYEQAMANQREAMAQQTAQSKWEQEMAMRQAEQDENIRRWNLQNVGVGLGAGAIPSTQAVYTPSYTPQATAEPVDATRINTIVRGLEQTLAYGGTQQDVINSVRNQYQSGQISLAEAQAILGRFGYSLT